MEFRVLGPLEVWDGDRQIIIGAAKQRDLLAALLLQANQTVPTERLIDLLWGADPPPSAKVAVQNYVSRLRRLLSPSTGVLVTQPSGYLLHVRPDQLDLLRFERLVGDARQAHSRGDLEDAAGLLRTALALWRGPALADVGADPLRHVEARRLEELRLAAVDDWVQAELTLGRHREIIAPLRELIAAHPLRERLRGQLMLALSRSGRRAEALEAYQEIWQVLADDLGLDPGEELQRLQRDILADPEAPPDRSQPLQQPCQLPPDIIDFTGRHDQIRFIVDSISSGAPSTAVRVLAMTGQAGIGKTTLSVRVAHELRGAFPDGQLYVDLHGTDDQAADPADVLARFLTALGMDGRALPTGIEERSESFRALLADRRMLLVLDNAASEQQVRPLLPGSPSCAVLVTSRRALTGLSAQRLALEKLDTGSALALLGRIAGPRRVAAEPVAARKIVALCDHLPLAVRIVGARIAAGAHWPLDRMADRLDDQARRLDELTTGDLEVRASVGASYVALTAGAKRAFRLLGLLDAPDFAAWVPAALLGIGVAQAEAHLDALVDAHLLVCTGLGHRGQPRFGMHDLIRLYARERSVEEDSEPERRAALARALGGWLALAEAAGRSLTERATTTIQGSAPRWHPDPATAAELLADPLAWFDNERNALIAGVRQAANGGLDEHAWELAAWCADYFVYRGHYDDWVQTHELALEACERAGNRLGEAVLTRNLCLLRFTGVKISVHLDMNEALRTFRRLGHRHGEVDMLGLLAFAARHDGDLDGAVAHADAAMATAQTIGYELGQGRLWYLHAVINREQGRYADAMHCSERCLGIAETLGTTSDRVMALWELAGACRDPVTAWATMRRLRQGIDACRRRRERLLEAYVQLALGELRFRIERDAEQDAIEQAVSVFQQHGVLFGQIVGLRLLGELERVHERGSGIAHLTRSTDLASTLGHDREKALTLKALGSAHHAGGADKAATLAWREALSLFEKLHNDLEASAVRALLDASASVT